MEQANFPRWKKNPFSPRSGNTNSFSKQLRELSAFCLSVYNFFPTISSFIKSQKRVLRESTHWPPLVLKWLQTLISVGKQSSTPCKNERGFLTYGYLSNLKLVRSSSITHHTHWHYNQLSEVQTAKSSFMFWICGKKLRIDWTFWNNNDHVSSGLKNLCKNRRAQMISKQKIATAKCTFNETLGFTAGTTANSCETWRNPLVQG